MEFFSGKNSYDTFIFDLDGTLTDPFEGITNSFVYALSKFGIAVEDKSVLKAIIGPPLISSFESLYGFDEGKALLAVKYYREYFAEKGKFENAVYPDIENVLKTLKNKNKQLVVATSKPKVYSKSILEHFNLAQYFSFISAPDLDESRTEKSRTIAEALEKLNAQDLNSIIMIGDRKFDISGAKQNGIKSAGVLYGYGGEEELTEAGADYLLKSPQDILQLM